MSIHTSMHPITITKPMVIIPAEEYRELLEEAGYVPTPKLDREIAQARARFRKGKTIKWKHLKDELRQLYHRKLSTLSA